MRFSSLPKALRCLALSLYSGTPQECLGLRSAWDLVLWEATAIKSSLETEEAVDCPFLQLSERNMWF